MAKDEKNPLVCDECGHESGAAFTARAHAKTHEPEKGSPENPFTREEMVEKVGEEEVARIEAEAVPVEKPKRTRKKAAK